MKLTYPIYILLIAVLLLSPVLQPASASPQVIIRYAMPHGLSSGACASWATACDLNYALSGAQPGEQVWAATGVYTPTLRTDPTNPRSATFSLNPGVALYGGFNPAAGADAFAERNWQVYSTTLSGDLKGDDDPAGYTIDELCAYEIDFEKIENAYHVVSSRDVTETAVLDGVIVSGGFAAGGEEDGYGGGMRNIGSPTLANSTFQGNYAREGGGGIINWGNSRLTNVVFRKNLAFAGGGLYIPDTFYRTALSLDGVYFDENAVCDGGGGMFSAYSDLTLEDVFFRNNQAEDGGGMFNSGVRLHLSAGVFEGNFASFNGGGIYNEYSVVFLDEAVFSKNQASMDNGGGIYDYDYNSTRLENVIFIQNLAHNDGGGIAEYAPNLEPELVKVSFYDNTAASGGGMAVEGGASLQNVIFSGNVALTGVGGGLYAGSARLSNVTFRDNSASAGDGGGLYAALPTLEEVIFTGNSSGRDGGGVYSVYGATLVNVHFQKNRAAGRGGGMLANVNHSETPTSLQNVAFQGNSASQGGGLADVFGEGLYGSHTLRLSNVTFRGNGATLQGGAIYHLGSKKTYPSSSLEISNSLLWGNSAPSSAEFYADPAYTTTLTALRYSLAQGGCPPGVACDHLLDADPLFVDDGPYNGLCLSSASPAVDAGDNTAVLSDTLDLDSDGDLLELTPFSLGGWLRFIDLPALDTGNGAPPLVDLGAYESPCPVYAIYFPWLSR